MRSIAAVFCTGLLMICGVASALEFQWTELPALPDREGFAGAFAGVSGDSLLVAGGANFPGKKPWEGGTKVWYDTVFALEKPDGKWSVAGKLPRALGYGVAVTFRDAMICVGGSDANAHYSDVFSVCYSAGKLSVKALPSLPVSLANMCGALVGERLYVAGGQERPDSAVALKKCFAFDLAKPESKWIEVEAWPGPARMLAVASACDGAFWLMGGAELVTGADGKPSRVYLKDAYRFSPGRGWTKLADMPHPVVAAPTPTLSLAGGPLIVGGDDGAQTAIAPERRAGFPKRVMRYDVQSASWIEGGELPAPRATTPLTFWRDVWVMPSGEVRPGVRSPEVWALKTAGGK